MSGWWFSPAQLVGNSGLDFPLHFASTKPLTLLISPSPENKIKCPLRELLSFFFFPLALEYREAGGQKGKLPRSFKAGLGK